MTAPAQHAPIAPSSLHLTALCAGSVTMQQRYPSEPDENTRDGEAAHFALAELLEGRVVAHGQIAPNGVMLTEEMLDAADMAADYVKRRTAGAAGGLAVERRVNAIPRIHAQCWGTPDVWAWLLVAGRPTLFVADFKYGHRFVSEVDNAQLTAYTVGILELTKYDDQQVDFIHAVIQPRCYVGGGPIREWTGRASDLRGPVNLLAAAAERALGPDPKCTPNVECMDCTARRACPALHADAYRSAQLSSSAVPFDLSPAAAGLELRMVGDAIKRLQARQSGLEEQVESLVRGGATDTGHRLTSTPGRETWAKPVEEVLALGEMMGVKVAKPPTVITPAQARAAGLDEGLVAAYAKRGAGSVSLVPDDVGRLARVFGGA